MVEEAYILESACATDGRVTQSLGCNLYIPLFWHVFVEML